MFSNFSIIFYWWSENNQGYKDLKNPIVPCIALIRSLGFNNAIYILNASKQHTDWGGFSKKLDFESINVESLYSNPMLSRIRHVHEFSQTIQEEYAMFLDCDIFWKCIPQLPFKPDNIACHEYNTGLYCFKTNSKKTSSFLNLWDAIISIGYNTKHKNSIMESYPCVSGLQDEAVYNYMRDNFKDIFLDLIQFIPDEYNYTGNEIEKRSIKTYNKNYNYNSNCKNYHCLKGRFKNKKGLFPMFFNPFYENILKTLSNVDIEKIYGRNYCPIHINEKENIVEKFWQVYDNLIRII